MQRALKKPALQKPFVVHCASAGTGLAVFALDEVCPHIPLMHSIWHVLSCVAVQQTLPLLQDADRRGLWRRGSTVQTSSSSASP